MVLEAIVSVNSVRKHPFLMCIDSFIVASIAIWLSFYIFPQSTSILSIAFITIITMPLIHQIFIVEEEEEETKEFKSPITFLERHFDLIQIYTWFFIGIIISFSLWYMILPVESTTACISGNCFSIPTKEYVFSEQEKTLGSVAQIRSKISGDATLNLGICNNFWNYFNIVFPNNLTVLFLAILFSFLYGAGALFLIGWNASVIGVRVGQIGFSLLGSFNDFGIFSGPVAYLVGLFNVIGFLPHGIFELPGFFVGAIAGGIISTAISKKEFGTHKFILITKDAMFLILVAIVLIIIGAAIEAHLLTLSC